MSCHVAARGNVDGAARALLSQNPTHELVDVVTDTSEVLGKLVLGVDAWDALNRILSAVERGGSSGAAAQH
jgi:hypothetical protein